MNVNGNSKPYHSHTSAQQSTQQPVGNSPENSPWFPPNVSAADNTMKEDGEKILSSKWLTHIKEELKDCIKSSRPTLQSKFNECLDILTESLKTRLDNIGVVHLEVTEVSKITKTMTLILHPDKITFPNQIELVTKTLSTVPTKTNFSDPACDLIVHEGMAYYINCFRPDGDLSRIKLDSLDTKNAKQCSEIGLRSHKISDALLLASSTLVRIKEENGKIIQNQQVFKFKTDNNSLGVDNSCTHTTTVQNKRKRENNEPSGEQDPLHKQAKAETILTPDTIKSLQEKFFTDTDKVRALIRESLDHNTSRFVVSSERGNFDRASVPVFFNMNNDSQFRNTPGEVYNVRFVTSAFVEDLMRNNKELVKGDLKEVPPALCIGYTQFYNVLFIPILPRCLPNYKETGNGTENGIFYAGVRNPITSPGLRSVYLSGKDFVEKDLKLSSKQEQASIKSVLRRVIDKLKDKFI